MWNYIQKESGTEGYDIICYYRLKGFPIKSIGDDDQYKA